MLLQMEYDEEHDAYTKLSQQAGVQRLVDRGDAWWPVTVGRSYYNSLNQLCVEVHRTRTDEDVDEDDHHFEFGKPVKFFSCDDETKGIAYLSSANSQVSYVDGDRMVIALPDNAPLAELQQLSGQLGVQIGFDETSYRLMFEALERTMRAKGRLGYLRDLFYTPAMRAEKFSFADMHFPYLNAAQEHAVNEVLRAKDVAIVHGPPGTGKTTTLVEAIYETLRRENQVLVCAQSNMAVDWIAERLVDRGLNVLRIGNPQRVDDKMLAFTYERRFESHPDYPQLWALRKAMRQLRQNRKRGDQHWHQKMDSLRDRATALEIRINQELFGEARVIASTLVGAGQRLLDGMKFGTLFIDEAAQALEAACWIPIRRASRVVLAGDHCQLPPTVKCYEALRQGLGKTLMERIVEQKPDVVTLLTMQYRMNEEIMRFSSDWFYQNKVESAPQVKYRSILDLDLPMTWIEAPAQTQAPSEREGTAGDLAPGGTSYSNAPEAQLTLLALQAYFEMIGKERILSERLDVGIISPYRAQVQLIRRLLRKQEFFKPFRQLITVNTVDGFQGQERDIILISLVRQNEEGQIGFLRELRRMNVAITRARMKLIILGDRRTLCRHPFYRKLWQYVAALKENP